MLLFGDYHTHTKYSRNHHGKSTIEQNVKVAVQKGLKEIGITEHGFDHIFFGVRRKNIQKMRAEIERLGKIYPIKIYLGIEANLISSEGDIDLIEEEQTWFDYVIMGYHTFGKPKNFKEYKNFFRVNAKAYKKNKYTPEIIQANTDAYIKAVQKNRINIISHLGSKMKVDPVQIAKVCKRTGTLIELNARRLCFDEKETQEMVKLGTTFILDSDAHICKNVGECNRGLNWVVKQNIPLEQVANLDKTPTFVWRKDE
ncbi:MAG: PHP domain-containing protein [Clostridia bacterium]|nr:PHP domain-containing protein [Clostridia bacterium]